MIESIADWGKLTLPEATSSSPWVWVVAMAAAIGLLLSLLEKKNPATKLSV